MIPLRIQRWWSLKPFIDKGVDHFTGTTRDERHFEFRYYYWDHRLAGCSHKGALMLARMELKMFIRRRQVRRETSEACREAKRVLDEAKHG